MSKKKIIYWGIAVLVLIFIISYFNSSGEETVKLTSKVQRGTFLDEVVTSGEAQSRSLVQVKGPDEGRRFNIYEMKIQDLLPEGVFVKKGDYIAKLDATEINRKIIEAQLALEKAQSNYTQKQLDTTLTMKQERNAIQDLRFTLTEDSLELVRSVYEPPSTVRSLEIKIQKAKRNLKERIEDYRIKRRKAIASMVGVSTDVSKVKTTIEELKELQKKFMIYSPQDGMITYVRDPATGGKKGIGSSVSAWRPSIVSLPDLTKMKSVTYSNEVDVRKIKVGQPVKVGFDAFPDITLKGQVTEVANVGSSLPGSAVKVFPITINLLENDSSIRPGMTTSNRILTNKKAAVLMVPIEAIFSKDTISYVYHKTGFSNTKQQVLLGESNNEVIIIKKGLKENDVVYLNKPHEKKEDTRPIKLLK